MKKIIYLFVVTLFVACSPSRIYFNKDTVFENYLLKLHPPIGRFYDYVDGFRTFGKGWESIRLTNLDISGAKYDVDLDVKELDGEPQRLQYYQKYFIPSFDWDEYFNQQLVTYAKAHEEQNMKFYEQEINYFRGLKCKQVSFSRAGGYGFGFARKNYSLQCGYYTTTGKKVGLSIVYIYSASISDNSPYKMSKDVNYKGKYYPIKVVEDDFKQRIKYMIDSIELKNIDIERMKKEGLYYEGREFKSSTW